MVGLTLLPASPAGAVETAVGPCMFRLDNPHRSQVIFTDTPVIRVHSYYKCASEVAYVNAQVQLRFCGPDPTTQPWRVQ